MIRHERINPNGLTSKRRHPLAAPMLASLLFATTGCNTISTLILLPPTVAIQGIRDQALNVIVTPRAFADAGADQLATLSQRIILNGSSSGVQFGSGSFTTAPSPALTFAWQITSSPVTDQNADGVVNATDLTAAGVQLDFADTAFPQFASPVAGAYVVQLTVTWVDTLGITQTVTDTANITVFATAP